MLFNESQNNEPLAPAPLPLSDTDIPPNLTAGVAVLNLIVLVPMSTIDADTLANDDEPYTVNEPVMKTEPVNTCVPLKLLPPSNFA